MPRAAASASRSRASLPSGWAAPWSSAGRRSGRRSRSRCRRRRSRRASSPFPRENGLSRRRRFHVETRRPLLRWPAWVAWQPWGLPSPPLRSAPGWRSSSGRSPASAGARRRSSRRAPLPRRRAPPPLPPRRPGAAFDPEAVYAARAPGVVTIYANLGIDGTAQGSGFVVDRDGVILTNAHVITNAAEARTNVQGARAVYVEFADGERIGGRVVGWDLFSDVGVIRVRPADHRARARAARGLGEGRRRRAGRRDRKPLRQAELADRRRRLGDGPLDRLPRGRRVRRLERDPDRRADQSRQLRRPALRRRRARDRHQRADREHVRHERGRRLRDPDRPRAPLAGPAAAHRARSGTRTSASRRRT